jgi:tetratricopeptide (TPR) repeat protein
MWLGCNKAKSDSVRLTNQGMNALGASDPRGALGYFQQAVDTFPDNATAHYGAGLSLRELEQEDRAHRHLQEAVRLDPELAEAHYQLAELAVRRSITAEGEGDRDLAQESIQDAEQSLRRVLELDGSHSASYAHMGWVHEQKGALKDAEIAYRRAVTLDPYQPKVFLDLSRLYTRVQATDEAMAVLQEGLRHNTAARVRSLPALSLLHNELGAMLQDRGQYGQAIDELRKALPGASPAVVFNLGWAYASMGDPELANRFFNQYVGLVSPDEPTAAVARDVSRHLRKRLEEGKGPGDPSGP